MKIQNYILLVFLIVTNFVLNAQDRSAFGLNFSSNYTFRSLTTNDTYFESLIDFRNEEEQGIFGFNVGGTYSYQFNIGLTILTGIEYTRFGYNMPHALFVSPGSDAEGIGSFQSSYGYLGVPLSIGYIYDLSEKLSISVAIGTTLSAFLDYRRSYTINWQDGTVDSDKLVDYDNPNDFYRFHPIFKSSLGLDYKFSNSFYLRLEPTLQYSLMPIVDAPVHERLYSIGLNTGVHYILRSSKK